MGLNCGSFPVRYLGVPLTSRKLRKQDYQPLVDRVSKRFNSWSVKRLSFGGRLQLIRSVIYSIITFWASILLLPNQCLEEIDQMCNGFLWRGAPNSARGAKVSWDSVCTPKECGGLGLRRLLAVPSGGSLCVSWVRRHLIGSTCFWDVVANNAGSWIWRNLCKLRTLARSFITCEIGSGITCSFRKDNWTSLGPLIDITGELGPRITGLSVSAVVADALSNGDWWISSSRSRNPVIQFLKQSLPSSQLVDPSRVDDRYLWKVGDLPPSSKLSTSATWHELNPPIQEVAWHKSIWFKGRIPKHAFIAWLAARNRLQTKDRLISWGLSVPPLCLLCNAANETHQHLFFDCPFFSEVWSFFSSKARVSPPLLFEHVLRWIKDPCPNGNLAIIVKLAFQASIYTIWKERNSRLHSHVSRPPCALIVDIKNTIRYRLDPLSRAQIVIPPALSLLSTWFQVFQL
ncbi:unnamed protein product [Arabidopsis lyrata]|nr:unnamed protein product [Arabidopsis lyrata]